MVEQLVEMTVEWRAGKLVLQRVESKVADLADWRVKCLAAM